MSGNKGSKRKIEDESRSFKEMWELDYFIINNKGKIQCVVCMQVKAISKEYNVKIHYTTLHKKQLTKYKGAARTTIFPGL